LQRVVLETRDVGSSRAFYEGALALRPGPGNAEARSFELGNGNDELLLIKSLRDGLHSFALTVTDEDDLDAIMLLATQEGCPIIAAPAAGRTDGERRFAALRDPDGNRVELVVRTPPSGSDAIVSAMTPRLGHLILWTPDPTRMERFYAMLGLRVSDRTHIGMSFMRCNGDHHSLGFARSSTGITGLQHVALDVGTEESVRDENTRLAAAGVASIWGPGRHGPGNNIFTYYPDPGNNLIELYGDMEQVAPPSGELDVRYWGPEHKGDISGLAGPPPDAFRL
jgi:catechol 2,3-dioxygenase-like lactoylglutathione lyase family enzyme